MHCSRCPHTGVPITLPGGLLIIKSKKYLHANLRDTGRKSVREEGTRPSYREALILIDIIITCICLRKVDFPDPSMPSSSRVRKYLGALGGGVSKIRA